jgi:hypothetical protein
MIGSNTSISVYEVSRTSGKDTYSGTALVAGLPAVIMRESMERASIVDMQNMHLIYRMTIDVDSIDIDAGDKVVDTENNTYIVHSTQEDARPVGIGARRVYILRKSA